MSHTTRRNFLVVSASAAGCSLLVLNNVALAAGEAQPAPVDAGAVTDYAAEGLYDKFVRTQKFFVRRKGDKLYAVSAVCTHKNVVLAKRNETIWCKGHGSTFDFDGLAHDGGKTTISLPRHKVSIADGKLLVDKSVEFFEKDYAKDGAAVTYPAAT